MIGEWRVDGIVYRLLFTLVDFHSPLTTHPAFIAKTMMAPTIVAPATLAAKMILSLRAPARPPAHLADHRARLRRRAVGLPAGEVLERVHHAGLDGEPHRRVERVEGLGQAERGRGVDAVASTSRIGAALAG